MKLCIGKFTIEDLGMTIRIGKLDRFSNRDTNIYYGGYLNL